MSEPRSIDIPIVRYGKSIEGRMDAVAIEEPLEIRIQGKSLSITMRTPGDDRCLAAGFLFTEGLLQHPEQIQEIVPCGKAIEMDGQQFHNIIKVILRPDVKVELKGMERNFYSTSSCGLCGKASLDALQMDKCAPIPWQEGPRVRPLILNSLPMVLSESQLLFQKTGGPHATGLFDVNGKLWQVYEDVGRHNAMDKLIGHQFLEGQLPLKDKLVVLSGRVSFELMQKAVRAGISLVAAVGAPSSLAVETAKRFNITLVGFMRDGRFNIYHGKERILADETTDC